MATAATDAPPGFRVLTEGSASILYEYEEGKGDKGEPVFYNKVQVLNRDLSIRMITLFARHRAREGGGTQKGSGRRARRRAEAAAKAASVDAESSTDASASASASTSASASASTSAAAEEKQAPEESDVGAEASLSAADLDEQLRSSAAESGIVIMDALAATGLRSIRYYKEVPGVKQVIVNDLSAEAVEAAKRNVDHNGLTLDQVSPRKGDAIFAMHQLAQSHSTRPDVIDLDPYGSAAPFLDAAVQCVRDGGLLCVTCTDMAVLSGGHPEVRNHVTALSSLPFFP